jgi:hypothetical protein
MIGNLVYSGLAVLRSDDRISPYAKAKAIEVFVDGRTAATMAYDFEAIQCPPGTTRPRLCCHSALPFATTRRDSLYEA